MGDSDSMSSSEEGDDAPSDFSSELESEEGEGGGSSRALELVNGSEGMELVPVDGRVDPSLLEEVNQYEAVPILDTVSYGKASFWDSRYAKSNAEPFEWYHPWRNLSPSLTQYMGDDDEILMCGCGTSPMSVDMCEDGFERITNVDISRVVIDIMEDRFGSDQYPSLKWVSMDLTSTSFRDGTFDVALDKACLDSMLCSMEGQHRAQKYVREINRVLRDDGAFICVSCGDPRARLQLLEFWDEDDLPGSLPWDVHVDAVPKPTVKERVVPDMTKSDQLYFIYICIKDPDKVLRRLKEIDRGRTEQAKKLAKLAGRRNR